MAKLNSGTRIYGNTTVDTFVSVGSNLSVTSNATVGTFLTVNGNLTYGTVPALNGTGTVSSIGAAPVALDWFGSSAYRGGKYIITVTDVTNTQYQLTEIHLLQDGTNANISSYGLLYSGTGTKMTFTANIQTGNVVLYGTGVSASNTVKLARTLIPV